MKFVVEFSTDNAAFQDALGNWEIAEQLRKIAGLVEASTHMHVAGDDSFVLALFDSNGNRIGFARTELEESDFEPPEEDFVPRDLGIKGDRR